MATTKESFDAVAMMRSIRDRLSKEFLDLSFEEQRQRIKSRLARGNPPNKRVAADRRATGS